MTFSYIINGEEFEGTSESITWYKYSESGDIELPSNSVIEARNYYSFTIFPGDSIIKRLDGRTIIYINGEDYSIGEDGDYYEAVDPMTDVNTVYDLFTNVETALEGNDGNALIQAVDAMMEKIDVYNNLSDYQLDLLAEKLNLADRATAFDYILDKWIDANTTVSALKLINAYVANPTKDTATELVDYIDSYKEMYGNTLNIEKYYNNLNKTYEEAVVKMVGVSNPNTFDGISSSILFGFISLAGIAGSVICLKGKANA